MTLEKLLRMEVEGINSVTKEKVSYSPDFRVAVQRKGTDGVHIIIHAQGRNSDTLDFIVTGNELRQL